MLSPITVFYSVRGSFAYLGQQEIARLARQYGRPLLHKPMLLSIVVPETGGIWFTDRHPARVRHAWDDFQRWAAWRNVPVVPEDPKNHYGPMELPSGLVVAAQKSVNAGGKGDLDRLAFEILAALWRDDRDIADPAVLDELAGTCGFDGPALREVALGEAAQSEVVANSREAVDLGVIGSPSYLVEGELFYGQDRLHFVEAALKRSAA
ncbi:DsbA family protein [Algihabitans albus]|uniref:2-hydroxychromene-2-carboxylate isomerase n=1 Tax=Algihabitans albus TaxID=2164067 RepID=UPI0035D10080